MRYLLCCTLFYIASGITCAKTIKIDSFFSDNNQAWIEQKLPLPKYPINPDWIEFSVDNNYHNKAYVDAKTIQIEQDKTIRFILRQLSPSGVENISYEGLICGTYQTKIYAYGDTFNKDWVQSNKSSWQGLQPSDVLHQTLHDIICQNSYSGKNAKIIESFRKENHK